MIMAHRAGSLLRRIGDWLPVSGVLADVGSGTGHNAEAIRHQCRLSVSEFDIANIHWIGPGAMLFDGNRIPSEDKNFDCVLLLFVLQYPESPLQLLTEAGRVSRGSIIVVQSTYRSRLGDLVLSVREFIWGRFAFAFAIFFRIVKPVDCPLWARRRLTREDLTKLFADAKLRVKYFQAADWAGLGISRDLFLLEPIES